MSQPLDKTRVPPILMTNLLPASMAGLEAALPIPSMEKAMWTTTATPIATPSRVVPSTPGQEAVGDLQGDDPAIEARLAELMALGRQSATAPVLSTPVKKPSPSQDSSTNASSPPPQVPTPSRRSRPSTPSASRVLSAALEASSAASSIASAAVSPTGTPTKPVAKPSPSFRIKSSPLAPKNSAVRQGGVTKPSGATRRLKITSPVKSPALTSTKPNNTTTATATTTPMPIPTALPKSPASGKKRSRAETASVAEPPINPQPMVTDEVQTKDGKPSETQTDMEPPKAKKRASASKPAKAPAKKPKLSLEQRAGNVESLLCEVEVMLVEREQDSELQATPLSAPPTLGRLRNELYSLRGEGALAKLEVPLLQRIMTALATFITAPASLSKKEGDEADMEDDDASSGSEQSDGDGGKVAGGGGPSRSGPSSARGNNEAIKNCHAAALDAAAVALSIMTATDMPRHVFAEDVVDAIASAVRAVVDEQLYQPGAPTKKTREVGKKLGGKLATVLRCIGDLARRETLGEAFMMMMGHVAVSVTTHEVHGTPTVSATIVAAAVDALREIATAAPSVVSVLLKDTLASVRALEVTRRSLRVRVDSSTTSGSIMESNDCQVLSASLALLTLLQSREGLGVGSNLTARDRGKSSLISGMMNNGDGPEAGEEDSEVAAAFRRGTGTEDASTRAKWVMWELFSQSSSKVVEAVVSDLLTLLFHPQWPGAELALEGLLGSTNTLLANSTADPSLRALALESVGLVTARLRKEITHSDPTPVVPSGDKDTAMAEEDEMESSTGSSAAEELRASLKSLSLPALPKASKKTPKALLTGLSAKQVVLEGLVGPRAVPNVASGSVARYYLSTWWEEESSSSSEHMSTEVMDNTSILPATVGWYENWWRFACSVEALVAAEAYSPHSRLSRTSSIAPNVALTSPLSPTKLSLDDYDDVNGGEVDTLAAHIRALSVSRAHLLSQSTVDSAVARIVLAVGEGATNIRVKALKALSKVIEADPTVVTSVQGVMKSLQSRVLDSAISVREAAVELLGRLAIVHPPSRDQVLPLIASRIRDTGIRVRKTVIRLLSDVSLGDPQAPTVPDTCVVLVSRMADEEETIRALVVKVFLSLWFPEAAAGGHVEVLAPALVASRGEQMVAVTQALTSGAGGLGASTAWLDSLIKDVLTTAGEVDSGGALEGSLAGRRARQAMAAARAVCGQIVEYLVGALIDEPTGGVARPKVAYMDTLVVFGRAAPELLLPHATALLPWLTVEGSMPPSELSMTSKVCGLFSAMFPLMETGGVPGGFLVSHAEEALVKIVRSQGKALVGSAVEALALSVRHVSGNQAVLTGLLTTFVGFLYKAQQLGPEVVRAKVADKTFWAWFSRALFAVGTLVAVYDFDEEGAPASEFVTSASNLDVEEDGIPSTSDGTDPVDGGVAVKKEGRKLKGKPKKGRRHAEAAFRLYMSFYTTFRGQDGVAAESIRASALQGLGRVFQRAPKLLLRARSVLKEALAPTASNRSKAQVLQNFADFLDYEATRMAAAGGGKTAKKSAGEAFIPALMQDYIAEVATGAESGAAEVRAASGAVIGQVLRQGLVHPVQLVAPLNALIAAGGVEGEKAMGLLAIIHTKHPTFLISKARESAIACSRVLAASGEPASSGATNVARIYGLVKGAARGSYVSALLRGLDSVHSSDGAGSDVDGIDAAVFACRLVAAIEYEKREDTELVACEFDNRIALWASDDCARIEKALGKKAVGDEDEDDASPGPLDSENKEDTMDLDLSAAGMAADAKVLRPALVKAMVVTAAFVARKSLVTGDVNEAEYSAVTATDVGPSLVIRARSVASTLRKWVKQEARGNSVGAALSRGTALGKRGLDAGTTPSKKRSRTSGGSRPATPSGRRTPLSAKSVNKRASRNTTPVPGVDEGGVRKRSARASSLKARDNFAAIALDGESSGDDGGVFEALEDESSRASEMSDVV